MRLFVSRADAESTVNPIENGLWAMLLMLLLGYWSFGNGIYIGCSIRDGVPSDSWILGMANLVGLIIFCMLKNYQDAKKYLNENPIVPIEVAASEVC